MNKLPGSQQELANLIMVSAIAGMAALGRILYGKDDLRWRYTIGSVIIAMATAWVVSGLAVQYLGEIGGQASAALAAGTGLFTDDLLRRIHGLVKGLQFSAVPRDPDSR